MFVVEDDTQNGTDHVDGHRGTAADRQPVRQGRGIVDSTYYTQLNVVKTIEQILGIAPMNQEDRAAEPMFDAFTNTPDLTPYTAQPNSMPLTYGLASSGAPPLSTRAAGTTTRLAPIQRQWAVWSRHQRFTGPHAEEDQSNPAQLNRVSWYSSTGWQTPYPGDTAILGPYQVPGWGRKTRRGRRRLAKTGHAIAGSGRFCPSSRWVSGVHRT